MNYLGIIFGLLAMVGYGLTNGILQKPVQKAGSLNVMLFRNCILSIMLLVPLFFAGQRNIATEYAYIPFAFLVSFISFVAYTLLLKAFAVGKVGIISPIANSSGAFTIVLAVVFYGEYFGISKFISFMFIFLGILLLSVNFSDFKNKVFKKSSEGIAYGIAAFFLFGLMSFLYKIPVLHLGPALSGFILEFGIFVYALAALFLLKRKFVFPKTEKRAIMASAFFGILATLSIGFGIQSAGVGYVTAIAMANPLVASAYARFAYKEKLTLQQYFGSIIVITGLLGASLLQ